MNYPSPLISRVWQSGKAAPNGSFEDCWAAAEDDGLVAIADGVTRHPPPDGRYPAPSPAEHAARRFCDAAVTTAKEDSSGTALRTAFSRANAAIRELNADLGLARTGPAHEDLASTVAAAARITDAGVAWAYIGDAGIAVVRDGVGVIRETPDDIEPLRSRFPRLGAVSAPDRHVRIRDEYRNSDEQGVAGFGVLTGEAAALSYVRTGHWTDIDERDVVAVFSDGFRPLLRRGIALALGGWAKGACSLDHWTAEFDRIRRLDPTAFMEEATIVTLTRSPSAARSLV